MNKLQLIAITAVTPVHALAHGAHAPLPEPAHGMLHAAPVAIVAVLVVAGLLAAKRGRGRAQ